MEKSRMVGYKSDMKNSKFVRNFDLGICKGARRMGIVSYLTSTCRQGGR